MHVCRPRRVCPAHNAFQPSNALQQAFLSISRHLSTSPRQYNDTSISSPKTVVERFKPRGLTQEIIAANVRQAKDIRPEDLGATLEAHRASNAAYAKELAESKPRLPFSQSPAATDVDTQAYVQSLQKLYATSSAQQLEASPPETSQTLVQPRRNSANSSHKACPWPLTFHTELPQLDQNQYTTDQKVFIRRKFVDMAIYHFRNLTENPINNVASAHQVTEDRLGQHTLPPKHRLVNDKKRRKLWRKATGLARIGMGSIWTIRFRNRLDVLVEEDAQVVHENNSSLEAFISNKGLSQLIARNKCKSLWYLYRQAQMTHMIQPPSEETQDPIDQTRVKEQGSKKHLTPRERRDLQNPDKDISQNQEYEGKVAEPTCKNVIAANKLPWFVPVLSDPRKPGLDNNPMERLGLEIKALHAYLLPNRAQQAARNKAIEDTIRVAQNNMPNTEMELFGSVRTGLAVASSDIDIRVYPTALETGQDPKEASRYTLRTLMSKRLERGLLGPLLDCNDYILVQFRHARFPLIALQHRETGLEFQIVASSDSSISRDIIKKYLETYPGLHELYNVVRALFDVRGFMDVYRGGLASYTVFIMVASVFRVIENGVTNSPAQNLLAFLSFWKKFDTYQHGLSLEPPLVFPKQKPTSSTKKTRQNRPKNMPDDVALEKGLNAIRVIDRSQPYLLCLQDPADPFNDLGYKTYGIKHIQKTLASIHDKLVLQLGLNDPNASLLDPVVGPAFTMYYRQHQLLEEYGEKVLAKQESEKSDGDKVDSPTEPIVQSIGEVAAS